MAVMLKDMERTEGRTTSELIREALRHYERIHHSRVGNRMTWSVLKRRLQSVARAGRQIDLSSFVAHDRTAH